MKKIYSIWALGVLLALSSCSKDDISTYSEQEAGVRFLATKLSKAEDELGGSAYSPSDQILYENYSFIDNPMDNSHEYDIPVALIGMTSKVDRKVGCEVLETSTAPEGSYEIVEAVIPAGEMYGHIRVKVFNSEDLNSNTYELDLRIIDSEDLSAGPQAYVKAHFSWNSQIPEPPHNNLVRTYNMLIKGMSSYVSTSKACYSPNAMRAIVGATGWNDWDSYEVHGAKYNNPTFYKSYKYLPRYTWILADNSYKGYAAKLKDWLKAYEASHGEPLLHDAGSLKGKPVQAREF